VRDASRPHGPFKKALSIKTAMARPRQIKSSLYNNALLYHNPAQLETGKSCLRRPGDDPLDPRLRMPSPFVPQGEDIREGFWKNEQNLSIKPTFYRSGKSLAPGRAAGGVFKRVAVALCPSFLGSKHNGVQNAPRPCSKRPGLMAYNLSFL